MKIGNRNQYREVMGASTTPEAAAWQRRALEIALDERAREIELYWKRTAYSWALTAAVFAGYFALANGKAGQVRYQSLGIVACLGVVCSAAWYCVNRGSKYWQENWEVQVDLLEIEVSGPLHRVNPDQRSYRFWSLNQAYPFSVSKVNQLLSLFVMVIWLFLAGDAAAHLEWSLTSGSPLLAVVGGSTIFTCTAFLRWGRTTPAVNVLGKTIWLKQATIDEVERPVV